MSRFLYRLGGSAAAHPWRTICAWILVAAAVIAVATASGGTPQDDYDVPGARAQVGVDQLREHAPELSGASAQVVVHDPDGHAIVPGLLQRVHGELAGLAHVSGVTPHG